MSKYDPSVVGRCTPIMVGPEGRHGIRRSHSTATRYGRQIAVLARARPAHPRSLERPAMTLREYGLLAQATDWLTFTMAIALVPGLIQVEVGPIGMILQTGGVLGSLAWKCAGLAVAYGLLSYTKPWGQFIGLLAVVTLGLIGTAGNIWALSQVIH